MVRSRGWLWGTALLMLVQGAGAASAAPNAADVYTQALKDAHLDSFNQADFNDVLANGYRSKVAVDQVLNANGKAFADLARGAVLTRCRFAPDAGVLDRDQGPYEQLKDLTLLYLAQGLRQYRQGDQDRAVETLLGGIRIGLQMQQDKIMGARSTGILIERAGFGVVERWLAREHPPAALLKRHMADVQGLVKLQVPFVKTIEAERQWTEASVADLARPDSTNHAFAGLSPDQQKQVVSLVRERAQKMYPVLENSAGSADFLAVQKTERDLAVKYGGKRENTTMAQGVADSLLEVLVPSFSQAWQSWQVARVEVQSLPALFALEAYHSDHHVWPKALTALVPAYVSALPRDPYGTGSYKYRVDTKGPVLYSVGPDRHDDGGRKPLPASYDKFKGTDIMFRL